MKLMTSVNIGNGFPEISHANKLLILGSCFSENIGEKLKNCGFRIDINPFGTVYNPLSVAETIKEIREGKVYTSDNLFQHDGLWHSYMHHGSFSNKNKADALHLINERLDKVHNNIKSVDRLLITWGTAYVYTLKDSGQIVSNCHKVPESKFTRRRLTIEEITDEYENLFGELFNSNKHLKIVLTISPIRHLRDGLIENQLSKSTLLLAADKIRQRFPNNVFYFPAYEILLDELRDYRFYADDLVHPSPSAIEYIWERFTPIFFNAETLSLAEECQKIHFALAHKPFHPEDDTYKEFLGQIVLKIKRLKEKYPYLELEN